MASYVRFSAVSDYRIRLCDLANGCFLVETDSTRARAETAAPACQQRQGRDAYEDAIHWDPQSITNYQWPMLYCIPAFMPSATERYSPLKKNLKVPCGCARKSNSLPKSSTRPLPIEVSAIWMPLSRYF